MATPIMDDLWDQSMTKFMGPGRNWTMRGQKKLDRKKWGLSWTMS